MSGDKKINAMLVIFLLIFVTAFEGHEAGAAIFDISFEIDFENSSLIGTDGRLEFNLLDGDGIFGNSSALMGGNLIFDPDQIINDIVLPEKVSGNILLSSIFGGGDPDLLILNLLDPFTNFTLVDTDLDALSAPVPYQDALFVISLEDGGVLIAGDTFPEIDVQVEVVPEPKSAGLIISGLLFLIFYNSFKRSAKKD